ncbi:MAG: hypothetical protein HQL99_15565 [Magnetococcales bacterium]|nr:hypothetical protein [Magnetococcales bacterium]
MNNRLLVSVLILFQMLWGASNGPCADLNDHKLHLGIKMFPALIGGNLDLSGQTDKKGTLLLLIVYEENRGVGEQVARTMNLSGKVIDTFPFQVEVCTVSELKTFAERPVAGVFLVESLAAEPMEKVTAFGVVKQSIVFSPFEGDVQKGVLAGMDISTQVKPALNLATLRKSGIRLNALFIKVAKTYE